MLFDQVLKKIITGNKYTYCTKDMLKSKRQRGNEMHTDVHGVMFYVPVTFEGYISTRVLRGDLTEYYHHRDLLWTNSK